MLATGEVAEVVSSSVQVDSLGLGAAELVPGTAAVDDTPLETVTVLEIPTVTELVLGAALVEATLLVVGTADTVLVAGTAGAEVLSSVQVVSTGEVGTAAVLEAALTELVG